MDKKIKHLEMIQGVINRMAGNSFALKGWAVTLLAGIYALSGKEADIRFFIVSFIPVVAFWLLDSYYLYLEKLYRTLYDKVREMDESDIDFSMNVQACRAETMPYSKCALSRTESAFYGALFFVCIVVVFATCLSMA